MSIFLTFLSFVGNLLEITLNNPFLSLERNPTLKPHLLMVVTSAHHLLITCCFRRELRESRSLR